MKGHTSLKPAPARALICRNLTSASRRDAAHYDAIIERNQEDQKACGHWGVPTFAFNGEPFFGQDRLDALVWRLQKNGLKAR
jgi:2-hydroxychromene-2-carboxylate isomerase